MPIYKITSTGNNILADKAFMDAQYANDYTLLPDPVALVPVDPYLWLTDIGPFFDRFGSAKMAVLTSPDAVVKAIVSDVSVRKWVDLKRVDVAQSLAYIGTVVTAVTPALQASILTTPVTATENAALRSTKVFE